MRAATAREIEIAVRQMEPEVRRSFLRMAAELARDARIGELEALVARGDVEGIITLLGITAGALATVTEPVRSTYLAGGRFEAPRAVVRFDIANPRAESWLRLHSSDLVTLVTDQHRQAIRTVLEGGAQMGDNPRRTALDIAGRIDKTTGRRRGGIIGLTNQQADWVTNARLELYSGDPKRMANYLNRERRDRRFDATVMKAIREERALTIAEIDRITARYSDNLLKLRAETIARTETLAAFSEARDQAWRQSVEEGKIAPDLITRTWSAAMDRRTREAHVQMNGQERAYGQPFDSPTGAQMMHPGDSSLGAGAEDIANCRCSEIIRADFVGMEARRNGSAQ